MKAHVKTHAVLLIGVSAAALFAGCATAPTRNDQLEQARADVRSLAQDPYAQQAAGQQLMDAENALSEANAAFDNHRPQAEVTHLAYLADRHALIGRAKTDEARAREQIAQAGAERDRILLEARSREAALAREQSAQSQQRIAALQEQLHGAQTAAQREQTQAELARLQAHTAQQQLQQQQQESAQLRKEQEQLRDLQARETSRGLEVTLGDVLFATNSANLAPGANLRLDRLAAFLRSNPRTRVIIEGYTDSTGSADYNERLSRARAETVADALQAQGISPDRLHVVGRGEAFPVASNDTSAGRQQNRRVDLVFSDPSGRFAEGAEQGPSGTSLR